MFYIKELSPTLNVQLFVPLTVLYTYAKNIFIYITFVLYIYTRSQLKIFYMIMTSDDVKTL